MIPAPAKECCRTRRRLRPQGSIPNPANDSASDEDTTIAPPQADLEVSKTNGRVGVIPGESFTYTIIAANNGPSDDPAATLTDVFAADLSCAYTSVATGGATGNTVAGSGNLADLLSMPAGSSVTYSVNCALDAEASGTLWNTATITPSVFDPNLGNNSASDKDYTGRIKSVAPDESVVLDGVDDSSCEEIRPTQIPPDALAATCLNPSPTPSCLVDEIARTLNVDAGRGDLCAHTSQTEPIVFPDGGIRSAAGIARLINEFVIEPSAMGSSTVPVQIATEVNWDGLLWPTPLFLPVFTQVTGTLQVREVGSGLVVASNTFLFERSGPTSIDDTLLGSCNPFGGCSIAPLIEFSVSSRNSTGVDLRAHLARGVPYAIEVEAKCEYTSNYRISGNPEFVFAIPGGCFFGAEVNERLADVFSELLPNLRFDGFVVAPITVTVGPDLKQELASFTPGDDDDDDDLGDDDDDDDDDRSGDDDDDLGDDDDDDTAGFQQSVGYCSPGSRTKLESLTLEYTGSNCGFTTNDQSGKVKCRDRVSLLPNVVQIRATGNKDTYFDGSGVSVGSDIILIPSEVGDTLASSTVVMIRDSGGAQAQVLKVHTSCSKPVEVGDQFGSLKVIALEAVPK